MCSFLLSFMPSKFTLVWTPAPQCHHVEMIKFSIRLYRSNKYPQCTIHFHDNHFIGYTHHVHHVRLHIIIIIIIHDFKGLLLHVI